MSQKVKDSESSSAGSTTAWDAMFSYVYVLLWIFLSATVILFNKRAPRRCLDADRRAYASDPLCAGIVREPDRVPPCPQAQAAVAPE